MTKGTEEEQVQSAQRVESFLKDESVKTALLELDRAYYNEFKLAVTEETRRIAQAKAAVLTDFALELRTVVDTGKLIAANNVRRDRK